MDFPSNSKCLEQTMSLNDLSRRKYLTSFQVISLQFQYGSCGAGRSTRLGKNQVVDRLHRIPGGSNETK